ncbi:MAG: hypothetical protein ABW034_10485 [Steroidobacteraceae bacterium]
MSVSHARQIETVQRLQTLLAHLNDAPVTVRATDFLLTDREHVRQLTDDQPLTDEQVLVSHKHDELQLTLYIDQRVLDNLVRQDPFAQLDERNLQDFCTALEGISHFHYLIWSAERGREVSLLELELQAEVDKYASAMLLSLQQSQGRFPRDLHARLFHRVAFAADLQDEHRERYHEANRQAAHFCRVIDERFLTRRRAQPEAWLASLRRFFRLGHPVKMRSVFA